ncbi:MAG: hypothetical protein JWP70_2475 [Leifsonia sp.]|nr:hypothetical protein [Leifsonia sp.]
MKDVAPHPDGLILVGELAAIGVDDRQLRAARAQEHVRRVRRGAYVPMDVLNALSSDARYDLRIAAVLGTRRSPVVLSHYSATRIWRLPIVNRWPREVHITAPPQSGRRTKNGVVVHRHELRDDEIVELDGMLVTSRLRTLVDVARIATFRDAVAALDSSLQQGLVTTEELEAERRSIGVPGGESRARRAIEFASPLAALPGESFSRTLMHELGFPPPELQHEFSTPGGGRRFADFWWGNIRLVGEFDGRDKYTEPAFTQGLTAEEVMWQEKLRENELRDHDTRITRWTWGDLEQVHPFVRRLEVAGLKRDRGRGRGAR